MVKSLQTHSTHKKITRYCALKALIFAAMQNKEEKIRFAIGGSGNVATRLLDAFHQASYPASFIFSSSPQAMALGEKHSIPVLGNLEQAPEIDVLILSWKDDALYELDLNIPETILLCHTAGSVPLNIWKDRKRVGVFYPLQTLSVDKEVDFSAIPLCIESNTKKDLQTLQILAKKISSDIRILNSEQRMHAHLAAVFVSNFVNYMYKVAFDIMEKQQIDFNILEPLITETANKIKHLSPKEAQTGPARRNDQVVLEKHMVLLKEQPELKELYKFISQAINNEFNSRS
jgi:predicted short-subunit dehydrogenase-like oxidoreductase (DUF2520 family)